MAQYRVLVIDDTRVIRLSVKAIFEKLGVEVLELGSVEELFEAVWKYHRIDLLYLDIDLPGMDGISALEKIRQERALSKVPVIMLTGNADPQNVKKAITAGIVDYVRKPFTSETLLRRARTFLNLPESLDDLPEIPITEWEAEEAVEALEGAVTAPPADAPAPLESSTLYAVITLAPEAGLPDGSMPILQLPPDSGLQAAGSATLVIPFRFTGSEAEAGEAIRQHLKQQGWPVETCGITPDLPLR